MLAKSVGIYLSSATISVAYSEDLDYLGRLKKGQRFMNGPDGFAAAIGVARPNAHGQEITSAAIGLSSAWANRDAAFVCDANNKPALAGEVYKRCHAISCG